VEVVPGGSRSAIASWCARRFVTRGEPLDELSERMGCNPDDVLTATDAGGAHRLMGSSQVPVSRLLRASVKAMRRAGRVA
jgi:hypothetical protein